MQIILLKSFNKSKKHFKSLLEKFHIITVRLSSRGCGSDYDRGCHYTGVGV